MSQTLSAQESYTLPNEARWARIIYLFKQSLSTFVGSERGLLIDLIEELAATPLAQRFYADQSMGGFYFHKRLLPNEFRLHFPKVIIRLTTDNKFDCRLNSPPAEQPLRQQICDFAEALIIVPELAKQLEQLEVPPLENPYLTATNTSSIES